MPPFWGDTEDAIFQAILKGKVEFESDPWPKVRAVVGAFEYLWPGVNRASALGRRRSKAPFKPLPNSRPKP